MAESLTQQVSNQLKIIKKKINRKFSKIVLILLTHKRAGSLGALAGFAIAVLFSWKFLRPVGLWRRQKKDTSSTSSSGTASASLTDSQLTHNAKEIEPTNDLWSPAKPVLEEIVKKKLNGSRKMTCRLLGVILEESIPEELQEHATIRSSVVEVLLEISKFCDIYLMERVLDDESVERVLLALENAGLFKVGCLMKEKVLFCSTENGRSSFVRQLEPDWHVDTDPDILSQLSVHSLALSLDLLEIRFTSRLLGQVLLQGPIWSAQQAWSCSFLEVVCRLLYFKSFTHIKKKL
ncbi:hypothetical protein LguiA_031432 [Lonicera macranthoides]